MKSKYKYIIYDNQFIKKFRMKHFVNSVYKNFIHLANYKKLNHTKKEIRKTIFLKNANIVFCIDKKLGKIVGYLLGYNTKLDDDRKVFFISYIFVIEKLRGDGIGTELMEIANTIGNNNDCNGIMLICDTEDQHVYDFYLKKNFMSDMQLRRYEKYDILYKNL